MTFGVARRVTVALEEGACRTTSSVLRRLAVSAHHGSARMLLSSWLLFGSNPVYIARPFRCNLSLLLTVSFRRRLFWLSCSALPQRMPRHGDTGSDSFIRMWGQLYFTMPPLREDPLNIDIGILCFFIRFLTVNVCYAFNPFIGWQSSVCPLSVKYSLSYHPAWVSASGSLLQLRRKLPISSVPSNTHILPAVPATAVSITPIHPPTSSPKRAVPSPHPSTPPHKRNMPSRWPPPASASALAAPKR